MDFIRGSFIKRRRNNQSKSDLNTNNQHRKMILPFPIRLSHYKSARQSNNNSKTIEDNRYLSKSLSDSNKQFNVRRISRNEKPIEVGNASIKPPNDQQNIFSIPPHQQTGVTVKRVSRWSKFNQANCHPSHNTSINQQNNPLSSSPTKKTGQVTVRKIRRSTINSFEINQRRTIDHILFNQSITDQTTSTPTSFFRSTKNSFQTNQSHHNFKN